MKHMTLLLMQGVLILGLFAEGGQAQATSMPASQPAADKADVPATIPDLCKGVVDPFDEGEERDRFFTAAGVTGLLDLEKYQANKTATKPFVRSFDRWDAMIVFDTNGDKKLDWVEALAYRKDLRGKVLTSFDADKDGKLTGEERDNANRALASGKFTVALALKREGLAGKFGGKKEPADDEAGNAAAKPNGEPSPAADEAAARRKELAKARQKRAEEEMKKFFLKHFDEDGDGELNEQETAEMKEFAKQLGATGKELERAVFDVNGDGNITPEIRKQVMASMMPVAARLMAKTQKVMDIDGDGKVSPEERQVFEQKVRDGMMKYGENLMKKFDADHDGRLNAKEREEFLDGVRDNLRERIKKYDSGGKGHLEPEDVEKLINDFAREIGVFPKDEDDEPNPSASK